MRVLSNVLQIGLIIIIIIYLLVLPIVIISLWNVALAQNIFWFLEISPDFPSKIIAGFTAVLAWATILLAFFAFRAIESGNKQNKINRKERKLNRIIDWATQILECNRDLPFVQAGFRTPLGVSITGYKANFNILSWRGVHIGFIAKAISRDVSDAVEHERKLLRQHKRIMDLEEEGKLRKSTAVGTHRKRIDESARTIIELAVKLL